MPRTRSLAFSELKIGILAVAALAIAATVIFTLSGEGGFFWERYPLKTRFRDVPGLKTGAPVRVAGIEVGTVRAMEFSGTEVEVTFDLSSELRPNITTDSVASLGSLSLLGQSTVDIIPATTGQPLPDWGYVRGIAPTGQLADVAAEANQALVETTRLIRDVRAGKGTMGRFFTDERLYSEIQGFIHAAEQVTVNLQRGRGSLGQLLSDPSVYSSLEASLADLGAMLRRLTMSNSSQLSCSDRAALAMVCSRLSPRSMAARTSASRVPSPTADFREPVHFVPASVIPRWIG